MSVRQTYKRSFSKYMLEHLLDAPLAMLNLVVPHFFNIMLTSNILPATVQNILAASSSSFSFGRR